MRWLRQPLALALALAGAAAAQTLPAATRARVDALAGAALRQLGAPSASVAIALDGHLAYVQAYGDGRIAPRVAATPAMRYSVGSISKQFTAAAVMLLVQRHKLRLSDPVAKFVPGLTQGEQVTVRELLSHTSGYEDYAPQDYMIPAWLQPTTPEAVVNHWARLPLNFPPGTEWQYSNTNYKIAGLIVEKLTGESLMTYLQAHIFTPLHMGAIVDLNRTWLGPADAQGSVRNALGPARVAPATAPGWDFGDGELGMSARQLGLWTVSLMDQSLLAPASYRAMETPVKLKDGRATTYGLGLDAGRLDGRRYVGHSGEEIGFTAQELVFPGARLAVVALTNQSANATASTLARQLAGLLLSPAADAQLRQAEQIFRGLQRGRIHRAWFTADANFYFNAQTLRDYASSLGPLGAPLSFTALGQEQRGGMTFRAYLVSFANRNLEVTTYTRPGGKIEQYLAFPHN